MFFHPKPYAVCARCIAAIKSSTSNYMQGNILVALSNETRLSSRVSFVLFDPRPRPLNLPRKRPSESLTMLVYYRFQTEAHSKIFKMKKIKIFIYHLAVFILGSIGIVAYVFYRLSSPTSKAGLGGIIVMPAVILIYVIVFGILCTVSLAIWLSIAYFRGRRRSK